MTSPVIAQSYMLSLCAFFVWVACPTQAQDAVEIGSEGIVSEEAGPDDEREQARALYSEGAASFESGDFNDALASFQACYDLSRLPALLFNLASSYDRLGRTDRRSRSPL